MNKPQYQSLWNHLRVAHLSWQLVWAWTPWLLVQTFRGLWIVWELAVKDRTWHFLIVLTAIWVVGKVIDEFTKPVKEPVDE